MVLQDILKLELVILKISSVKLWTITPLKSLVNLDFFLMTYGEEREIDELI